MLFYLSKILSLVLLVMCFVTTGYADAKEIISPNIVINLPNRMLELYSGNTLIKEYPVAIGKPSTPTPLGQFNIIDMEKNPTWIPEDRDVVIPSGPDNPLGYRWMRFFELYGIHGTNEPWSIGKVVSNGCIRMQEENVEELFEIVKKGTPVKITYERIKLKISNDGLATLGIYPDVYSRKAVTLDDAIKKLGEAGVKGLISDGMLLKFIREEAGQQIFFAKVYTLKLNGKELTERGIVVDGIRYIPAWAVAKVLQRSIVWDEKNQVMWRDKHKASGIVKGDVVYISEEGIKELFYGETVFNPAENCLDINILLTNINGKPFLKDLEVIEGVLALPVLPLADALGLTVTYDGTQSVLLFQGRKLPVPTIEEQPYIKITKVNEYFNADLFWNDEKHVIDITYPGQ